MRGNNVADVQSVDNKQDAAEDGTLRDTTGEALAGELMARD